MILVRESRCFSRVMFTPERSEGVKVHEKRTSFPNMYRTALFQTTCERFDFEHTLFAKRVGNRTSHTECRKTTLKISKHILIKNYINHVLNNYLPVNAHQLCSLYTWLVQFICTMKLL